MKNKRVGTYDWLIRTIAIDATAGSNTGKASYVPLDTANGGYSWPRGLVCVGSASFIAGSSGDRWQVRKSTNAGATWELVDDYRYNSNYLSEARGIAADTDVEDRTIARPLRNAVEEPSAEAMIDPRRPQRLFITHGAKVLTRRRESKVDGVAPRAMGYVNARSA